MGERTSIHIVVDDETKERWSQAAEEDETVKNRSEMVRRAVEQYISEDDGGANYDEEIADILQNLHDLKTAVNDANNTLQGVEQDILDTSDLDGWAEGSLLPLLDGYIHREELEAAPEDVEVEVTKLEKDEE